MSDVRNDRNDTIWLVLALAVGALILITNYFLQIVLLIGVSLLGIGTGFLTSVALRHVGKRWGFVGVLELIVTVLTFKFFFGTPLIADSWRGAVTYFGVAPFIGSGFRDVLWGVGGLVTVVGTIAWSVRQDKEPWNEYSEKLQNGATHIWAKIAQPFFWATMAFAKRFFGGSVLASSAISIVGAVLLGVIGVRFLGHDEILIQIVLNTAIFWGMLAIFYPFVLSANKRERLRVDSIASRRQTAESAEQIRRQEQAEKWQAEADKQKKAQAIRAKEEAQNRHLAAEKERALKEAIAEARPGRGTRTDLKPLNEKGLRDDDLF